MGIEFGSSRPQKSPVWRWLLGAGVVLLSACGGGGDDSPGGEDLYLNFSYGSATFALFEPGSHAPAFPDLHGRTPHCSLGSGSLPPGMSLQSDGCRVVGTPSAPGSWSATMVLTVDGYTGSLSSSASFTVPTPFVRQYNQANLTVPWGEPFKLAPAVSLANFTGRDTDQVTFNLEGALPEGVTFDGGTGTLAGTTTATPSFTLALTARIVRGGFSFTTGRASISVGVLQSAFGYDACCNYVWAVPFKATPTAKMPAGATVTYAVQSGHSLPPGIALDPATGVITGVPQPFEATSPAIWGSEIVRTITSSSGQRFTTTATMWPSFVRPSIGYDNANPAHLKANQRVSLGLPMKINLLPGDVLSSFSLASSGLENTAAPSWMHIDATTGEVTATLPGSLAAPVNQPIWSQDMVVNYSIVRNGVKLNGATLLGFYID